MLDEIEEPSTEDTTNDDEDDISEEDSRSSLDLLGDFMSDNSFQMEEEELSEEEDTK